MSRLFVDAAATGATQQQHKQRQVIQHMANNTAETTFLQIKYLNPALL